MSSVVSKAADAPAPAAADVEVGRTLAQGGKDRLLTVLRGASMIIAVLTHVGMATVKPNGNGLNPAADGAVMAAWTWLFSAIAVWFSVGGALSRRAAGTPILQWWTRRAPRLLIPFFAFVAVLSIVEITLRIALGPGGICGDLSMKMLVGHIIPGSPECVGILNGPHWFLFAYIPLALFAPWLVRIYDSRLRFIAPIAGLAVVLILDMGVATGAIGKAALGGDAFSAGSGVFFLIHLMVFWAVAFYLGFFYADGYVDNLGRKALWIALGIGGLTAIMVVAGPWPTNAWGAWHNGGNQFPPTLAWMAGLIAWMFFVVWARKPIEQLSVRPVARRVIDWLSDRSLTILIWHMSAYAIVYWFVRGMGWLPAFDVLPIAIDRAIWVIFAFAALVPVVNLFYPIEVWSDRIGKQLQARYDTRFATVRGAHDAAITR